MQETPPILRGNTKYNRLIKSIVFMCFMMLLLTSFIQLNKAEKRQELKYVPQINQLSAGVNKHVYDETAFEVQVVKLDKDIVTSTQDNYISIDQIEISRDMDLTELSGISREEFCEILANFKYDYDGYYERNAGTIWDYSQTYHINEFFMCGLFGLESGFGASEHHKAAHNYGSIMSNGKLVKYASDTEGIEANYKLFANHYFNPEGKYYKGVTLDAIGDTYCPPTPECPSWADRVYKCMKMFLPQE